MRKLSITSDRRSAWSTELATLRGASIVIVARKHNPTIVSKAWLAEKGIMTGPVGQFVHTEMLSLVEGADVTLTLDENRLSLTYRTPTQENVTILSDVAQRFVDALPETPYVAVGLNFTYAVSTTSIMLGPILAPADKDLRTLFGAKYELAGTAVFNYNGFVVKAYFPVAPSRDGLAEATFNFHADIDGHQDALDRIGQHKAILDKVETIVERLAPTG
ncbi:MAG: hypothetical protein IH959_00075 [Chloroflexi bacterium]|nr:hypothetical protein [Chloroflexota bacterium]